MRSKYSLVDTNVKPYYAYDFVINKPTHYIGNIGDVIKSNQVQNYRCTFSLTTKLSSTSFSNVINLVEASISGVGGVALSDLIGVDLDDGRTHWTTITVINNGNITIAEALPSQASIGNGVYVSRII